jgi:hypothetical protein
MEKTVGNGRKGFDDCCYLSQRTPVFVLLYTVGIQKLLATGGFEVQTTQKRSIHFFYLIILKSGGNGH